MMKALLDTHTALFAWGARSRLSKPALQFIEAKENQLVFSQVSTIEIALKHKIGKLDLPMAPVDYVLSRVQLLSFEYVIIDEMDIAAIEELPSPHRDPFDCLLLATARRLRLPIISCNKAFEEYPVELIW